MAITKSQCRDWARAHFRGFENILMPSFTSDFSALDEAGIRNDVRRSIEHGVFSVFAVPLSLGPQEEEQYFRIVSDEAAGRISVGYPLLPPTPEIGYASLATAARAGCTHVLIHPWHTVRAETEDELYRYYRQFIDATDLPVVLWATDGPQFTNLHPSNVCVNVFDRLADLPNVVALKLMTTLDLPTVFELCERLHHKVLVGGVHLGLLPMLVKHYGMTWSGAWTIEALQSPERPLVVDYLNLLLAGRWSEATRKYWELKPAYEALFALMAPMLPKGVHPFTHLKYYQWAVGGNGGLLREPMDPAEREFPLRAQDRAAIKAALRSVGIEPRADDDTFIVGRANAARGVQPAQLAMRMLYAA
jgi:4-hydroxy-tetrahydrodipicolinate synthase